MEKTFDFSTKDVVRFVGIVLLWLGAYKSADVFNFFATYSSLWFLPAGVTLSIALAAPHKFVIAPLLANLLLAIPAVCSVLGIEFTGYIDPILHSFRLFIVYAGAGLLLRHVFEVTRPIEDLKDELVLLVVTASAAIIGALSGVVLHVAWVTSLGPSLGKSCYLGPLGTPLAYLSCRRCWFRSCFGS